RGQEVEPAARADLGRVEPEDLAGDRVEAAEVVEEPAVQPLRRERLADRVERERTGARGSARFHGGSPYREHPHRASSPRAGELRRRAGAPSDRSGSRPLRGSGRAIGERAGGRPRRVPRPPPASSPRPPTTVYGCGPTGSVCGSASAIAL